MLNTYRVTPISISRITEIKKVLLGYRWLVSMTFCCMANNVIAENYYDLDDYSGPEKSSSSVSSAKWILSRIEEIEVADSSQKTNKTLMAIKSGVSSIKAHQEKKDEWSGNISFSYEGKDTTHSDEEDFKFISTVDVSKTNYIDDVRVKIDLQVEDDGDNFKESVGSLLLNWDRYIHQNIETFAFSELFTIDQLGIDQRWELGAGIKFEYHPLLNKTGEAIKTFFLPQKRKDKTYKDALEDSYWEVSTSGPENLQAGRYLGSRYSKSTAGKDYHQDKRLDLCKIKDKPKKCNWKAVGAHHFKRAVSDVSQKNFRRALRRKNSKLEFGFSAAVLREFNDSSVNVEGIIDGLEGTSVSFDVPVEQNAVLSVRPKVVWKFTDGLSLKAEQYFKKRLDSQENNRLEHSKKYDYGNSLIALDYKVSDDIEVSFSYVNHFENEPFIISSDTVQANSDITTALSDAGLTYTNASFREVGVKDYERFYISIKKSM